MSLGLKLYSVFSVFFFFFSLFCFSHGFLLFVKSMSVFIEWSVGLFMSSEVIMSLIFDWMSLVFLGVVSLISGCILKYSVYYMEGEKNYYRFVYILCLFVGSMGLLIISPNLISLLLGWDGLGLSSYALVIFYQSESCYSAGMITVLSNRVGDVAILMGVGFMSVSGSWSFYFSEESSLVLLSLVVLAGVTKSAQVPFSAWLPAAMAAPTPVSALVHSSTLVTAGVYLLIRFNSLLMGSGASKVLFVLSILTTVMAGINAIFESDLKKVVALSTLSQLGLMVMSVSLGMSELAFFHLITHAMFKSGLFMCVGFMIHSAGGFQDSRRMSGFGVSSPVLMSVFSLVNMALVGFPFLSGFYSKDMVLEQAFSSLGSFWASGAVVLATGLTMGYSVRVLYLSFGSVSNLKSVSGLSEGPVVLVNSLICLGLMSCFMGGYFSWGVYMLSPMSVLGSIEKFYVLLVCLGLGLWASYYFSSYYKGQSVSSSIVLFSKVFSQMMFLPWVSTKLVSVSLLGAGEGSIKVLDKGWLEHYGGQGGRDLFLLGFRGIQVSQRSVLMSSFFVSVGFVGVFVVSFL